MPFFVPGDLDLWPLTLTFKLIRARDQARLRFCMNLAQIRSAVPEIFHTQTKNSDWRRKKQNLPQFTVCGNNCHQFSSYSVTVRRLYFTNVSLLLSHGTFYGVYQSTFSTLSITHVALPQQKRCYAHFLKVRPKINYNKNWYKRRKCVRSSGQLVGIGNLHVKYQHSSFVTRRRK